MRPRFLLDEHLNPRLADAARRAGLDVAAVSGSDLVGTDDRTVLMAAAAQKRILVTYDVRDFVPLLRDLLSSGISPPGLVMIHSRTLRPDDLGGLLRSLISLAGRIEHGDVDPSMGIVLTR